MKRFLAVALMALSFGAFASTDSSAVREAGWNNLTELQKAEITKQVATQAETNKANPTSVASVLPDAKKVDDWVNVGQHIGQMMGGAAKEVGVAVNDFGKTPVGQWTMFLIVWKVLGATLMHVIGGFLVLIVGGIVMSAIYRRATNTTIEYNPEKTNWLGNHPVLTVERACLSDSDAWFIFMGSGAFTVAAILVAFVLVG